MWNLKYIRQIDQHSEEDASQRFQKLELKHSKSKIYEQQVESPTKRPLLRLSQSQMMIEEFLDINWNFMKFQKPQLCEGFVEIMKYFKFHEDQKFTPLIILKYFVAEIGMRYRDNLYHSFKHGFSVFHFSFTLFRESEYLRTNIPKCEMLAHLLACIAHDVEHPGVNNQFLVNAKHEMAIKFNEISVLENHHASVLFQLLSNPRTNVLENFPEEEQKVLKKQMIQSILATDPARHKKTEEVFLATKGQFDTQTKRQNFLDFFLHLADIHNPALKWDMCKVWARLVIEEFTEQTRLEDSIGIEVTSYMLLGKDIDFLVQPTFSLFVEVVPNTQFFIDNLNENKQHWEQFTDYLELF